MTDTPCVLACAQLAAIAPALYGADYWLYWNAGFGSFETPEDWGAKATLLCTCKGQKTVCSTTDAETPSCNIDATINGFCIEGSDGRSACYQRQLGVDQFSFDIEFGSVYDSMPPCEGLNKNFVFTDPFGNQQHNGCLVKDETDCALLCAR
eukprot:SAG31_NODE_1160_length_9602_cov_20.626434_10_plen_151_part_00